MRNPYAGKDWWRKVRLPQIEGLAAREILRYETKAGKIDTPWIPVDELMEHHWKYELLYDNPATYGAVSEALAVLRPDLRLVVVSDQIEHKGRMDWSIAHEGGHIVAHIPRMDDDRTQGRLFEGADVGREKSVYCRGSACGFMGSMEEPYMYREAEYFAGCLLMPRNRYLPLAEKRLIEALGIFLDVSELSLRDIESSKHLRPMAYNYIIEHAVSRMADDDLNGGVSKHAQKIRLSGSELGLITSLDGTEVIATSRRYARSNYELSQNLVAKASQEWGLDYSPEWRGTALTLE